MVRMRTQNIEIITRKIIVIFAIKPAQTESIAVISEVLPREYIKGPVALNCSSSTRSGHL